MLAPELGRLAFGSDFPNYDPDPLRGLYAARTRGEETEGGPPSDRVPFPQTLDPLSALSGYTSGAAFACRQDARRGRLSVGFAADLTVLTVDPIACAPEELLDARVRMTVVNGEIVYRSP